MSDIGSAAGGNLPVAGAVAGISHTDEWRALFARYAQIVLVANSDSVDIAGLRAQYPVDTLFVFFNKVYKVLDAPFPGDALLISRGSAKGANIVYRREVGDVVKFFPKGRFLGIMNIRLNAEEKLNTAEEFENTPTGHLDLAGFCNEFYPEDKLPTSGFAIALWLSDLNLPGTIVLAGFSARRSQQWKVVSVHDWNFEQVFLRLFARMGKISIHGGITPNAYAALAKRFPDIPSSEISLAIGDVLSERLGNANAEIDKLISLTNVIRDIDNFFRRLKPRFLKRR
ncbi:3-deoxy-manno-octulosonate cytidylyltransferase [Rhizobium sp. HT1-10]|uniref:3-deoxy-manno-octulosonate cytidylyltransferase n=1 Tax=Rhizobium sp. HT1-10 TaxID=3111638 RepID=UPI003C25CDA4